MESTKGLRGISAGETSICEVKSDSENLLYRSYDILELVKNSSFEETAYLLLYEELPTIGQLNAFKARLIAKRNLPQKLKETLKKIPRHAHPMDVLRTGCSFLGVLETENNFKLQNEIIERLIAVMPAILLYWYHYSHNGISIEIETDTTTTAGHFLNMLYQQPATEFFIETLDTSLILYAEHEFNASTFAARICASTLSDMHSCVSTAIGTLRGELHGGANEKVMYMLEQYKTVEEAQQDIKRRLQNKEIIMGFGHAVYRTSDPRSAIIQKYSKILSQEAKNGFYYKISEEIENIIRQEKKLFPNADYYHATAYHFMNIPTHLFTPIFVCSRISGWAAHIKEQRSNNRIIRPSCIYTGSTQRKFVPIEQRN